MLMCQFYMTYDRWFYLNAVRPCKHLWQRLTRGFDDSETWDLMSNIAEHAVPRLKRFREVVNGWPSNDFDTFEEWQKAIDKMIWSLECVATDYEPDLSKGDMEVWQKHADRVQEGLTLFGKHFTRLWW